MSFFAEPEIRRARTMHTCWVCGRKIESGETYRVQKSYQDGWVTFRECAHCVAVLETAWNLHLIEDEWDRLDLYDALREWSVATARMAVGIKRRWVAFCGYRLLPIPDVIPRPCCEHGCDEPVGARSFTWCDRHDAERIERLNGQFAELASAFNRRSA